MPVMTANMATCVPDVDHMGFNLLNVQMATIIKRNTSVPCSKRDTFTTTENFQECIDVDVYEGERACTDGNHKLGNFQISGIQRAKRGDTQQSRQSLVLTTSLA